MTTLDELTQKACNEFGSGGMWFEQSMRAAVLAVLAEVRAMVPAEKNAHSAFGPRPVNFGYNACRAEMLRRLDAAGAPK